VSVLIILLFRAYPKSPEGALYTSPGQRLGIDMKRIKPFQGAKTFTESRAAKQIRASYLKTAKSVLPARYHKCHHPRDKATSHLQHSSWTLVYAIFAL
jgi:hypothetical protein